MTVLEVLALSATALALESADRAADKAAIIATALDHIDGGICHGAM